MPTPVFSFPYHEVIDQYPDSSQKVSFGGGYEFASKPIGPDQKRFILKFPAMWWYESSGAVDAATNPTRNMAALIAFYESVRMYDIFQYTHPRRGTLLCRFAKPLVTPRVLPGRGGLTEQFDVELIEVPVLSSGELLYTDETKKILAAITVAPNTSRKSLIDYTVRNLKQNGIWDLLDALYVHAAADEQSALINWIFPYAGLSMTKVGSPTFEANRGITGANTIASENNYVGHNFQGMGRFQQDDASFSSWVVSNLQSARISVGSSPAALLVPRNASNNLQFRVNASAAVTVSGITDCSGLLHLNRIDASTLQCFRNGTQIGGNIASTSIPIVNSRLRTGGNSATDSGAHQIALVSAGKQFTAAQVASFYTIMREYLVAVGCPVP